MFGAHESKETQPIELSHIFFTDFMQTSLQPIREARAVSFLSHDDLSPSLSLASFSDASLKDSLRNALLDSIKPADGIELSTTEKAKVELHLNKIMSDIDTFATSILSQKDTRLTLPSTSRRYAADDLGIGRRTKSVYSQQVRCLSSQKGMSPLTKASIKAAIILPLVATLTGDPVSTLIGAMTAFGGTIGFGPLIVPVSRILNSKEPVNFTAAMKEARIYQKDPTAHTPNFDLMVQVAGLEKGSFVDMAKQCFKFSKNEDVLRLGINRGIIYGVQPPLKNIMAGIFKEDPLYASLFTCLIGVILEQLALFSADAKLGYRNLGLKGTFSNRINYGLPIALDNNKLLSEYLLENEGIFRGLYELSKSEDSPTFKDFLKGEFITDLIKEILKDKFYSEDKIKLELANFRNFVDSLDDTTGFIKLEAYKAREVFRGVQYSSTRDFVAQAMALTCLNSSTPIAARIAFNFIGGILTTPPNNLMLRSRQQGELKLDQIINMFKFDKPSDLLESEKAFEKTPFRLLLTTVPLTVIFLARTEFLTYSDPIKNVIKESGKLAIKSIDTVLEDSTLSETDRAMCEAVKSCISFIVGNPSGIGEDK